MKIYVVHTVNGEYEDRVTEIVLVTENEDSAYSTLFNQTSFYNHISVWENGREISEYYREVWRNPEYISSLQIPKNAKDYYCYGKWERNCGEINEKLEELNK